MKNLLILAIISQLCIYVNTSTDPIFKNEDKICDFVGTHTDLTPTFVQRRTKQCICQPGFYGHRCEKIYKCRSGRPINISCYNPEEQYARHAVLRCIRGQVDLEVCECFVGYTGFLCQKAEVIANPEYADLQTMEHGVVHDGSEKINEKELKERYDFMVRDLYESRCHSDILNDPIFKFVILPSILLILLCICVICVRKLIKKCRKSTGKYISVSTIPVPDSESAPPPYQQVEHDLVKSYYSKKESSRTSTESSDEALPMPPSLRPYLHV
ncbi:unnamed protein product [Auanema sp. JU1783]|nr:unnamed protein product [Auanema sp. JU1783]